MADHARFQSRWLQIQLDRREIRFAPLSLTTCSVPFDFERIDCGARTGAQTATRLASASTRTAISTPISAASAAPPTPALRYLASRSREVANFSLLYYFHRSDSCWQTYAGAAAFSEAESIAMRDVLSSGRFDFKASVSVHSNAQLWISPHGYTTDPPADYAEMVGR